MSQADRLYLVQSLSCPAMNSYACSEHLTMGTVAEDEQSMILFDENLIFEFHEDHCVVSNLFNYTLPMIRYRMADLLQPDQSFNFRLRLKSGQSAVANKKVVKDAKQKLQDILQRKQMGNISFTVNCVDDLPVNPQTGKFQLIVPAA